LISHFKGRTWIEGTGYHSAGIVFGLKQEEATGRWKKIDHFGAS
jgi:hypothetical protein